MSSKKNLVTKHKKELRNNTIITALVSMYVGMRIGNICYVHNVKSVIASLDYIQEFPEHLLKIYPVYWPVALVFLFIPFFAYIQFYWDYTKKVNTMFKNAHGSGGFNENMAKFYKDYLYAPSVIGGKSVRNDEGKKVTTKKDIITEKHGLLAKIKYLVRLSIPFLNEKTITQKNIDECKAYAQIYSQEVYMSLDCKFTMRNLNALYMGASGTGKSRFAVKPNMLQANSSFVVTDPSGEILADVAGFLEKVKGYKIKVLNLKDLACSCRYNPFMYCTKESDIPVLVNCMKNNIDGPKGGGGGSDGAFWDKATLNLTVACCSYLFEVYDEENEYKEDEKGAIPEVGEDGEIIYLTDNNGNILLNSKGEKRIKYQRNPYWKGHRNFTNVMNMLHMAEIDEMGEQTVSGLDRLFADWELEHPKSYAVKMYKVFKMNAGKTALNVLITTATTFGTYFELDDFVNLTYKDEMEIESIGLEKTAVFLIIPEGEKTFNFLAAMFYTQLFQVLYRLGEQLRDERGGGDPELNIPCRIFLDEMANIGSVPEFNEKLSTMRKYRISAVPIFQSLAQLKKLFEKDWEVVLGNCDTMVFLGGAEPSETKMLSEKLGKETVKTVSNSESYNRSGGASTNRQEIAHTVLDTYEIEQMKNNEQLVFIRGVRPFLTEKYCYEMHPNYKYTSAVCPENYYQVKNFALYYSDEEIDSIMVLSPNDPSYVAPAYRGDRYNHTGKKVSAESLASKIKKIESSGEENVVENLKKASQESFNSSSSKTKTVVTGTGDIESTTLQQRAESSKIQCMATTEKERIQSMINSAKERMNLSPTILSDLAGMSEEEIIKHLSLMESYTPEFEFSTDDFKWKENQLQLDDFDEVVQEQNNVENSDTLVDESDIPEIEMEIPDDFDDSAGWASSWVTSESDDTE